jgi:Peptidase S24-like
MIEAHPAMDRRDLARLAVLEAWRRDGATDWIEATGGSMLPLIRPGDRLLVRFGAAEVRRGDVVIFRHAGAIVAHRIVGDRRRDGQRRWIAKGDNEPLATEDVGAADLLGIVRAIDRGSGRRSTRGLGGRAGGVTAWISRLGGSLARASARRTSPFTSRPIAGAAFAARSALSLWTGLLASSRKVESLAKGGEKP